MRLHHVLIAAAVALGGCAGVESVADRFDLEDEDIAALSAGNPVAVQNGHAYHAMYDIKGTQFDQYEYTETVMATLSRALAKRGVPVAPDAKKSVTLKVRMAGYGLRMITVFHMQFHSAVMLEVALGNGEKWVQHAKDWSPGGYGRSFDASALRALSYAVRDPRFVAYLKE